MRAAGIRPGIIIDAWPSLLASRCGASSPPRVAQAGTCPWS